MDAGRDLHDADAQKRREAARALGSAKTPAKVAAARAVAASRKGATLTQEQRDRQAAGQRDRWERTRQEREAIGLTAPVAVEKRAPGRPRKEVIEATGEKRSRGRPRKQAQEGTEVTA